MKNIFDHCVQDYCQKDGILEPKYKLKKVKTLKNGNQSINQLINKSTFLNLNLKLFYKIPTKNPIKIQNQSISTLYVLNDIQPN